MPLFNDVYTPATLWKDLKDLGRFSWGIFKGAVLFALWLCFLFFLATVMSIIVLG